MQLSNNQLVGQTLDQVVCIWALDEVADGFELLQSRLTIVSIASLQPSVSGYWWN